jgi:hypothetical protein
LASTGATLEHLLDTLADAGEGERVTFAELVDAFGDRGFGALLVVAALLAILPTGAIPGVGSAAGVLVAAFGGQMLVRRRQPWLPGVLARRGVPREQLSASVERSRRVVRWLGRVLKPRLNAMISPAARRAVAAACFGLGLVMTPMGPVPMASAILGGVVLLFGLGLVGRDGLFVLAGWVGTVASLFGLALLVR